MISSLRMPGGQKSKRELPFFWICDCSGSMSVDGKIEALNNAIREAIPGMQEAAASNHTAKLVIRALTFSSGAQWHIEEPTPVEDFKWRDLQAGGITDMGKAFSMVADRLDISEMGNRALPPVLVLISDGQPTDDYVAGLKKLLNKPLGKMAVRIAIAIGRDASLSVLEEFTSKEIEYPLVANNADTLARYIQWVSRSVPQLSSSIVSPTVTPSNNDGVEDINSVEEILYQPAYTPPDLNLDDIDDDEVW